MTKLFCVMLFAAAACMLAFGIQPAAARPTYKAEFDKMYVKKDSTDPAEAKLTAAVAEVKCNICHVGKEKKERNAYGKALDEYLSKEDAKDIPKIIDALKKVEAEHSVKEDATSPTFGELFKKGELPTK